MIPVSAPNERDAGPLAGTPESACWVVHRPGLAWRAYRMGYDARLVEEAVLRAVAGLSRSGQALFHRERDVLYELRDPDEREAQFQQLHGRWFTSLKLDVPLGHALAEEPGLIGRTTECRILVALSRKDEGADLFLRASDPPDNAPVSAKIIVLRLRPESLLEPAALLAFLRHEFMHVADMLDPRFGYAKELPASDAGPSYDNILRDRYRIVWDTAIDGRLFQRGLLSARAREARLEEFARVFPMLGALIESGFSRWFDDLHPTHPEMVAFVQDPRRFSPQPAAVLSPRSSVVSRQSLNADSQSTLATAGEFDGRCPICRFPTATLDAHPERLPAAAVKEIEHDHPSWRVEHGLCAQCADLYLARLALD